MTVAETKMIYENNAMPNREESEEQLGRILRSAVFATHPVPRSLLERLVKDTLDGKVGGEDYEHALGVEIFRKPAKWIPQLDNAVRQGMSTLRKYLGVYYSDEGSGDKVDISLPKRSGFAARFSYRPVSNAEESMRPLADTFWHTFPDVMRCGRVVQNMRACVGEHPSYAPGYAVLAEAILACAMCDETYAFSVPKALLEAEEAIKTGMSLNGEIWRMHVVAGALHCCRFAWDKADAAFKAALRLAPEETGTHFWYAAFLFAVGRVEEAKECVTRRLRQPPAQLTPLIRPLSLYIMREFKSAYDEITSQSPLFWDVASRMDYYAGHEIVPIDNWLGEILVACLCLALNYNRAGAQYAEGGVKNSKVGAFNGILILLFVSTNDKKLEQRAKDLAWRLQDELKWQSPVSLALACMGMGQREAVFELLLQACDIGHPLMVWLHLWPVFDPLRSDGRFKALIKSMNLPRGDLREG